MARALGPPPSQVWGAGSPPAPAPIVRPGVGRSRPPKGGRELKPPAAGGPLPYKKKKEGPRPSL